MFEQAAKPRDVASVSAVDNEHNLFGYPGLCADAARESRDATPFSPERYYDGDAHFSRAMPRRYASRYSAAIRSHRYRWSANIKPDKPIARRSWSGVAIARSRAFRNC